MTTDERAFLCTTMSPFRIQQHNRVPEDRGKTLRHDVRSSVVTTGRLFFKQTAQGVSRSTSMHVVRWVVRHGCVPVEA